MKRSGISDSYTIVFEHLKKICLNIILSVKIIITKKRNRIHYDTLKDIINFSKR